MVLRRYILSIALLASVVVAFAQKNKKFDPKRFETELRQYITSEAGLTPKEAAAFFPLYDEMQKKQRLLFDEMRQYRFIDTTDDKASLKAIKSMDDIDLQIKKLQRDYHLKFCKVLSPGKVMKILQADEKFHRKAFMRVVKRGGAPAPPRQ